MEALGEEGGHVKAGRAQRSIGASFVSQADSPCMFCEAGMGPWGALTLLAVQEKPAS